MTLARFLSRKLLVFLVATAALFLGNLPPEHWVAIATFYMGVQGLLDWRNPNGASSQRAGSGEGEGTL